MPDQPTTQPDPIAVMLLLLAWRDGQRHRPRRPPGQGTVRRYVDRARGRIVFRARYGGHDYRSASVRVDLPPAEREEAEKAARQVAEAALVELKRRVDRGETPSAAAERRTVARAVAAFLEETDASRTPATARTYRHWCKRIADAPLARVALRDVRRGHVASWLGWMRARGESDADRAGAFDRLLQVLRRELAGDADLNNLRAVLDAGRELRPAHQQEETRPFTEAEARLLLEAGRERPVVAGVPIGPVVAVCLYAACRIGEALGLRWRDLDPFSETLTVAQQIGPRGPAPVKGQRATTLPVDADLVALLLEHRRREAARGRRCLPDELVFVDQDRGERALTYARARGALLKLTAAAGLEPSAATHRLKHAAAMLGVAAGTPVPVLQRALRHRSVETTMKYAGHEDPALSREAARALGRRLRGPAEAPA